MKFENVVVSSIGYTVSDEMVTSTAIETQLAPLYERLRLPKGRLELMTGIAQRRFWSPATLPSEISIQSGRLALAGANLDPAKIGVLIHGSVCRDHLEPATACRVHHELHLPERCAVYDVSNACLGMLSGMTQVAALIELGHIHAGMIVGTENGRSLVETTIQSLLAQTHLTRQQIKSAMASLTIGSASAAIVLCHRDFAAGSRLTNCVALAKTAHHTLCRSERDDAIGAGMQPLMETDSEQLMLEGITAAEQCYQDLIAESANRRSPDKTVGHQVGVAHRRLLLERLEIEPQTDFATYPWLGNTGSTALPVSLAVAIESSHFSPGEAIGLLGIGSGINVVMMRLEYDQISVAGQGRTGLL